MPVSWIPREFRRKYLKDKCAGCGISKAEAKKRKIPLALHHMDRDRTNNIESNFETFCGPCHTTWHWEHGKDEDFMDDGGWGDYKELQNDEFGEFSEEW